MLSLLLLSTIIIVLNLLDINCVLKNIANMHKSGFVHLQLVNSHVFCILVQSLKFFSRSPAYSPVSMLF